MSVHADYLGPALSREGRREIIAEAIERLRPHAEKFKAIAVTGMSGLLIGPAIADALDKDVIIVRKNENCHARYGPVEGALCSTYCIVDDMTCSCDTLRTIINKLAMSKEFKDARPVSIYLYLEHYRSVFCFEELSIPNWSHRGDD